MFAKMLYKHINSGYVNKVRNYVDAWIGNRDNNGDDDNIAPYPNQFERAGAFSPSGEQLRDMLHDAERSNMTATG